MEETSAEDEQQPHKHNSSLVAVWALNLQQLETMPTPGETLAEGWHYTEWPKAIGNRCFHISEPPTAFFWKGNIWETGNGIISAL